MGVVGDCFVAKLPRCSGEAIIETGGDLDTSESDGEVEVRPVFFSSFTWKYFLLLTLYE